MNLFISIETIAPHFITYTQDTSHRNIVITKALFGSLMFHHNFQKGLKKSHLHISQEPLDFDVHFVEGL